MFLALLFCCETTLWHSYGMICFYQPASKTLHGRQMMFTTQADCITALAFGTFLKQSGSADNAANHAAPLRTAVPLQMAHKAAALAILKG